MASGSYTFTNIRTAVNGALHGKLANLTDTDGLNVINRAVRYVVSDIDLRGMEREAALSPNLYDDVYDYALPADLKGEKIIDIIPQTDSRGADEEWSLVTPEYFDRRKRVESGLVAIIQDDLVRRLRLAVDVDDEELVVSNLDTRNAGGDTWTGINVPDTDVKTDGDDFVEGSGSVRFQNDTADVTDTSVGIQNKGLDVFDISKFLASGIAYVRGKLVTGDTNIKQLNIRLGSDTSNYYAFSDSTTIEGNPFQTGWNRVSVSLASRTTTGTPVDTAIDYAAVFWSKDSASHTGDTGYAFDNLILKRGPYYSLQYYTNQPWQTTSTLVNKLNSTATTDLIMLLDDEIELVINKAAQYGSQELRDYNDMKVYEAEYERLKSKYKLEYPSKAMILQNRYHYLESLGGSMNSLDS